MTQNKLVELEKLLVEYLEEQNTIKNLSYNEMVKTGYTLQKIRDDIKLYDKA